MLLLKDFKTKDGEVFDFMHGACHYLALGLADEYNCKVVLWVDYDEDLESEVLIHAFVKIGNNLFLDNEGFFQNIEDERDFDYCYGPNFIILDKEEAKKILKKLKIHYTNVELKRYVREYIRSHCIAMQITLNDGISRFLAYYCETNIRNNYNILLTGVNPKTLEVYSFIHTIPILEFNNAKISNIKIIPRKKSK